MHRAIAAVTILLATVAWGCERDGDDQPDEPETEAVEQEELEPLEGPFDGAHDPEQPVDAEDFGPKLVESICLAYDNCRNEEIKSVIFRQILMTAAFEPPEIEDDERAREFRETVDRLQDQQTMVPSVADCETVFDPIFVEGAGLDESTLEQTVDEQTVSYDPEAAGECLAQFGQPFELCETKTEVDGGPVDSDEVLRDAVAYQSQLVEHFRVCDQVFEGTLEEGEECRFTYECVDDTHCEIEPDEQVGECTKPVPGQPEAAPAPEGAPGPPGGLPGTAPGGM